MRSRWAESLSGGCSKTPFHETQPDIWLCLSSNWAHQNVSAAIQSRQAMREQTDSDNDRAIRWPQDKQIIAEPPLFNMTFCALTFTDQAIHWPAVASHHRLPPRGRRCPSCPFCWLKWCASWELRRRSPHRTAPDPPGRAGPGSARRGASGCRSSSLEEEKDGRGRETNERPAG